MKTQLYTAYNNFLYPNIFQILIPINYSVEIHSQPRQPPFSQGWVKYLGVRELIVPRFCGRCYLSFCIWHPGRGPLSAAWSSVHKVCCWEISCSCFHVPLVLVEFYVMSTTLKDMEILILPWHFWAWKSFIPALHPELFVNESGHWTWQHLRANISRYFSCFCLDWGKCVYVCVCVRLCARFLFVMIFVRKTQSSSLLMFYDMLCLSQQISASLKTKVFVNPSQEKHKLPTGLNIWVSLRIAQ